MHTRKCEDRARIHKAGFAKRTKAFPNQGKCLDWGRGADQCNALVQPLLDFLICKGITKTQMALVTSFDVLTLTLRMMKTLVWIL